METYKELIQIEEKGASSPRIGQVQGLPLSVKEIPTSFGVCETRKVDRSSQANSRPWVPNEQNVINGANIASAELSRGKEVSTNEHPFPRSQKIARTPPQVNSRDQMEFQTHCTNGEQMEKHIEGAKCAEEDEIYKCTSVLKQMKAATEKQKNVSMAVKSGILQLEESLSIMLNLRLTWKRAEKLRKSQHTQTSPQVQDCQSNVAKNKRGASSPADNPNTKKGKTEGEPSGNADTHMITNDTVVMEEEYPVADTQWTVVQRKSKQTRRKVAHTVGNIALETDMTGFPNENLKSRNVKTKRWGNRLKAISIKPTEGQTYASILKDIKSKVNLETVGAEIKAIRQTKEGSVLLEISNSTKDTGMLSNALKEAVGDSGTVKSLVPTVSLEVRDLDCTTEKGDVIDALQKAVGDIGNASVYVTETNTRGQRVAIIQLDDAAAIKLLNQEKIKIGWVYCRVRRRAIVERCFRCLGYGHKRRACQGPDRNNCCFNCGEAGHPAKGCPNSECCVLCNEAGENKAHRAGTGKCKAFRYALERVKISKR